MRTALLAVAAATFITATSPAFAQTTPAAQTPAGKDECLLASQTCLNQVDDIYKRMHKLNKEIRKGTKVYTPAELKKLQEKLQEADDMLRKMEQAGGS